MSVDLRWKEEGKGCHQPLGRRFSPKMEFLPSQICLHLWPPRGLQHPCFDSLLAIKAACCTYAVTMEGFQLSQQESKGNRILVVLMLLFRILWGGRNREVFLAVQDSSIGDIVGLSVCRSVGRSQLTIRA